MSNFIVGQITPDLIEDITYGTFIFFGLLTTGGVIFVFFFVPETKRLSLEVSQALCPFKIEEDSPLLKELC